MRHFELDKQLLLNIVFVNIKALYDSQLLKSMKEVDHIPIPDIKNGKFIDILYEGQIFDMPQNEKGFAVLLKTDDWLAILGLEAEKIDDGYRLTKVLATIICLDRRDFKDLDVETIKNVNTIIDLQDSKDHITVDFPFKEIDNLPSDLPATFIFRRVDDLFKGFSFEGLTMN